MRKELIEELDIASAEDVSSAIIFNWDTEKINTLILELVLHQSEMQSENAQQTFLELEKSDGNL